MWSVLRRYQGITQPDAAANANVGPGSDSVAPVTFADKDKSFRHNQRLIALHEWREHQVDPRPAINSVPYDRYCYEKALRLAAPEAAINAAPGGDNTAEVTVEMRRGALGSLIQKVFEKPHNVHHLIREPALVPALVVTAAHSDDEVRRATCVLLRLLAQDRKGAEFLFSARKDEPASEAHVATIAFSRKNAFAPGQSVEAMVAGLDEVTQLAPVRRRLADVGEIVRWVLLLCMDPVFEVATEALKAMAVLHGFADSPEYTFALMRAQCVPVYAEIVKAFRYDADFSQNVAAASSSSSSGAGGNNEEEGSNAAAAAAAVQLSQQRALTCAAALHCLRLVTNAKEAFLEVLRADVLAASLRVVTDFAFDDAASLQDASVARLLSAALNLASELVLYTAGSNAGARRQKQKLPTLLPCARLAREHPDAAVRRDAAGALATLCVSEVGKAAALEEHGVVALVRGIIHQEEDRDVVSSGCRIVCLLSELPAARQQLVDLADRLNEIASVAEEAKDKSLHEGAARAAQLVVWVPGQ